MEDEDLFEVCKAAFFENDYYTFKEAYLQASDETRIDIRDELMSFLEEGDFMILMADSIGEGEDLEDGEDE